MIYRRTRSRLVSSAAMRRIVFREYPDHTLTELALKVGYKGEDGLRRALFGARFVGFDTADRILTRLGLYHLWHEDPSLLAACAFLDQYTDEDWERHQRNNANKARSRRRLRERELKEVA